MKKIVISIFVVSALFCISAVSAGKYPGKDSPESVVTCASAEGTYLVLNKSMSGAINTDQCKTHHSGQHPDPCSLCISSLENQGCKMVDVVVDNAAGGDRLLTYLLSCVKP